VAKDGVTAVLLAVNANAKGEESELRWQSISPVLAEAPARAVVWAHEKRGRQRIRIRKEEWPNSGNPIAGVAVDSPLTVLRFSCVVPSRSKGHGRERSRVLSSPKVLDECQFMKFSPTNLYMKSVFMKCSQTWC
jgi:hypothetical protein